MMRFQAVYYPLSISHPEEKLAAKTPEAQVYIRTLQDLVKNDLLDKFVQALWQLTHPQHRIKHFVDEVKPLLPKSNTSATTKTTGVKLLRAYKQMLRENLDTDMEGIGS